MKKLTDHEAAELRRALSELREAMDLDIVGADDIFTLLTVCRRKATTGTYARPETPPSPPPPDARNWDRNGTSDISCPYCLGLGFKSGGVCEVCKGAKVVRIPNSWVQCGPCLGLGFQGGAPCPACKGFSRVPVQEARGR